MALVEYSDSETSGSAGEHGAIRSDERYESLKRKRVAVEREYSLPPLPDSFHDLYASTSRASIQDDPALHAGRQRQIPHKEGNWPSHVYIEWYPSTEESNHMHSLITELNRSHARKTEFAHSLLKSDLGADLPLHISLSRPIMLLTNQRQNFIDRLTREINEADIRPCSLSTNGIDWVANYEQTRCFLVLRLKKPPRDTLNKLLNASNRTVLIFGQPTLYSEKEHLQDMGRSRKCKVRQRGLNASTSCQEAVIQPTIIDSSNDMSSHFHVSVGWNLGSPQEDFVDRVKTMSVDRESMNINVSTVKVKIGNNITSIPLSGKETTADGIIGR